MSFDLPDLPDSWAYAPLEACCKPGSITYGIVQPGAPVSEGVPIIRVNNFRDSHLDLRDVMRVAPEVEAKYGRTRLNGGEVLLTIVGSVGQVAIAPANIAGFNVARAVAVIDPFAPFSADWIALCLRSPLSQHLLGSRANTTVQTTINLKDLRALPIPLPPPEERHSIAALIGALDDRITLLRETNATLEGIAQALFKSWFVDFDPVRAKMEGLAPEGMDEATAALFPDSFEGTVPKGWIHRSLKEVCRVFDAKRVPLSGAEREQRRGQFPYYGAAALMDYVNDFLFDGVYLLTGEDGSVADSNGFPITQYVWGKFWVNNHAHVLQGADGVSTEHLMLALKQTNIQPFITGAVQAKLSQSNMWRIKFLWPGAEVVASFGNAITPLFACVRQNCDRVQTLIAIRDTLLPRLISGQLRLSEAQDLAEDCVS